MRLATILDDGEIVTRRDRGDRDHVRGLAVEVHRQYRSCPGRDRRGSRLRVEREPLRVDISKHRPRAGHHDRERGIRCRQWRRDDLVPRTYAERTKRDCERVGPGPDADRGWCLAGIGEFLLEGVEFRPQDEPAPREYSIDGRPNRAAVLGCNQNAPTQRQPKRPISGRRAGRPGALGLDQQ